jgi:hypothetical protein
MPDNEKTSQKQKEKYCASQVISSTDTDMNQYKKFSQTNEINFTPKTTAPTPSQHGITNEIRGSIIVENSTAHHITKHLGPKKAFLDAEYRKSVKNEENALKNEEQNMYFDKPLFQRPTFSELYENTHSKVNNSCNEQLPRKDIKEVQEFEIGTSSESEDELTQKLMLSHEPEIMFTEDEKQQLDKLVLDHDTVYHSVNFGEVLIKEMLMCSMFGVAMSTSAATG